MGSTGKKNCAGTSRSQSASTLVELACMGIVLVPVALLAVNICYLAAGSYINDAACREAARAASQQTSLDPASGAAQAAVQSFAVAGGLIGSPQVTGVVFDYSTDSNGNPIEIADLDKTILSKLPTVQVTTQLTARVPAPLLMGSKGLTNHVVLSSSYTFPALSGVDPSPNDTNDTGSDNTAAYQPTSTEDTSAPVDTTDSGTTGSTSTVSQ